jgi:hypothetical protein
MDTLSDTIHVVLSCTNRKRETAPDFPLLRDVPGDVEDRALAWTTAIDGATPRVRAEDLYVGEYWRAGQDFVDTARDRFGIDVWVMSAGLGLVRSSALVCAYSATLTRGHPDSVVQPGAVGTPTSIRRRWWSALATWPGPSGAGQPRSLADVAAGDPAATIAVVAGPDYIDAATDDLVRTREALAQPDQLVIFSSRRSPSDIAESTVTVPGRLRTVLGGSMASTGPRAARAVIEALPRGEPLRLERARSVITTLDRSASPLPKFDRKRMEDDEISEWIGELIANEPSTTKSVALRTFRGGGMACEQDRFGRLFEDVTGVVQ